MEPLASPWIVVDELAELHENPLGGCVELEEGWCGYAAMLPRSMLLPGSVADLLQVSNKGKPKGYEVPRRTETSGQTIARCPQVTAFVMKRASGICECCLAPAPFFKPGGAPYLEVHHVDSLGEGGRDMIENAVAVCPNCHRECHHGESCEALKTKLLTALGR